MNSLFKLFEILEWIIRSGGFDGEKKQQQKKQTLIKKIKIENEKITDRLSD